MLSYIILRSTAAFGGAPFRLNKCTALGSAGDGALDGFDGLVLVNGLDVHGNDLAGIHVQKILQKLVAQVRSRNIQETDRPEDTAHLKGTVVLKCQCSRGNGILYGQTAGHKVFPVEMELVGSIHVQHPMHQPQTLRTVQRFRQNAKPVEVVHQVILDVLQPRFNLCHAVALDAIGQKLRFGQAVVSLGKLLPQHLAVLGSHIIKAILLSLVEPSLLSVQIPVTPYQKMMY